MKPGQQIWAPPLIECGLRSKWCVNSSSCLVRWEDSNFVADAVWIPAPDGSICGWAMFRSLRLLGSMCMIYEERPLSYVLGRTYP